MLRLFSYSDICRCCPGGRAHGWSPSSRVHSTSFSFVQEGFVFDVLLDDDEVRVSVHRQRETNI